MPDKDNDLALRAGHRERLRQNFLDNNIAKYELLELLLSYAIPRHDVRPLSRLLYKKFGGIYPILSASVQELMNVPGVGKNVAIFIKVVQQIMLEGYKCKMSDVTIFHSEEQFNNYCLLMLSEKHIEELHVLYLDTDGRLLEDELHSTGSLDYTELHNREIIKKAISLDAKFIVLVHNHPKPNSSFSSQDVEATKLLRDALHTVEIVLYDHYVVSGGIVYSMKRGHML